MGFTFRDNVDETYLRGKELISLTVGAVHIETKHYVIAHLQPVHLKDLHLLYLWDNN